MLRDPSEPTNTMLVGDATRRSSAGALRAARRRLPAALRPVATRPPGGWRRRCAAGAVYTDDCAPVEWLIDASIVQVAARGER